jgi:hypothetical protein
MVLADGEEKSGKRREERKDGRGGRERGKVNSYILVLHERKN